MTSEQKARLDTCVEFYKQQMEHYHRTQAVEWKGTFGAWALAATAVALTFHRDVAFRPGAWVWFVLLIPICHAVWLWKIHDSEEEDKWLWVKYRNEASTIVGIVDKKEYTGRSLWVEASWIATEAGPSAVLAGIFIWRICS